MVQNFVSFVGVIAGVKMSSEENIREGDSLMNSLPDARGLYYTCISPMGDKRMLTMQCRMLPSSGGTQSQVHGLHQINSGHDRTQQTQ